MAAGPARAGMAAAGASGPRMHKGGARAKGTRTFVIVTTTTTTTTTITTVCYRYYYYYSCMFRALGFRYSHAQRWGSGQRDAHML